MLNIGPLGKILTKISTKEISSEIYPKLYLKYFSEISYPLTLPRPFKLLHFKFASYGSWHDVTPGKLSNDILESNFF